MEKAMNKPTEKLNRISERSMLKHFHLEMTSSLVAEFECFLVL